MSMSVALPDGSIRLGSRAVAIRRGDLLSCFVEVDPVVTGLLSALVY